MTDIKLPLGLIEPNFLKNDEAFLMNLHYEMIPNEEYKIFRKGKYFVIWNSYTSKLDKKFKKTQKEFPLQALPWFIDTIEDKFWNHQPDPNAQPGDVSESTLIDDEKVGVNPARHCCAENLFGYSFWNVSRKSYISKRAHQQWQIPKFMLEEGLLDKFKKISTDLGLKAY